VDPRRRGIHDHHLPLDDDDQANDHNHLRDDYDHQGDNHYNDVDHDDHQHHHYHDAAWRRRVHTRLLASGASLRLVGCVLTG
jgi:hypothetical protein